MAWHGTARRGVAYLAAAEAADALQRGRGQGLKQVVVGVLQLAVRPRNAREVLRGERPGAACEHRCGACEQPALFL